MKTTLVIAAIIYTFALSYADLADSRIQYAQDGEFVCWAEIPPMVKCRNIDQIESDVKTWAANLPVKQVDNIVDNMIMEISFSEIPGETCDPSS